MLSHFPNVKIKSIQRRGYESQGERLETRKSRVMLSGVRVARMALGEGIYVKCRHY